jgi:amino acid transporter
VYITLFVLIILCIFIFGFLLFRIYSIEKKQKEKPKRKKKKQNQKHLPPFEAVVGFKKPLFQLAVAAYQPTATQLGPATTVAILPPFVVAAGTYRHFKWRHEPNRRFKWRFEAISANVESHYLFS